MLAAAPPAPLSTHPSNDDEVVTKLVSAPLGTREMLRTGRIGTKVGMFDGAPLMRCADGDFTCVHGESHSVLRAILLKNQVCSCKPISVVQEKNVPLSDDYEYGLCNDETVHSFLSARRSETVPLAYDNVYIQKNGNAACKCAKGMQCFDRRDVGISERLTHAMDSIPCDGDEPWTAEAFDKKCEELEHRGMIDRNTSYLMKSFAAGEFPHDAVKLTVSGDGQTKKRPMTSDEIDAYKARARELRIDGKDALRKYRGCLCARPRIMRRKGSLVRFVKPAVVPKKPTPKKRKTPPDDNFYIQVAPNARALCHVCERPIRKGSFEVTHLTKDNKRKRVVCLHLDCSRGRIQGSGKATSADFLSADEHTRLMAEREKLRHGISEIA